MSWFRQYLTAFRNDGVPSDGLFEKADGTVWLRNPDGSETQLPGGGGSIVVQQGATSVNPTTKINFTSGATVTDAGGGEADVAVNGGSQPVNLLRFDFAFDTADLEAGAPLHTLAEDEILLNAWFEIDTAWDGTTPFGDIGVLGTTGLFRYVIGSGSVDMTAAGFQGIGNLFVPGAASQVLTGSGNEGSFAPARAQGGPTDLLLWVSSDGTQGGGDPAASQGAGSLYLLVGAPTVAVL